MKLNSDIINYHFARKYPIQYIPGSGSESELGRPLYYHPGTKQTAHLLLLREPVIPDLPGTFLCFSDGPVRPSSRASVFVFPEQADREDVYNALQELYDYYDEWENTCMQIVEKFQDFRSLIRCTYQYFRIPLCLLDNQFNIIASEHEPDSPYALFSDAGQINLDTVNDIISNPHFRDLETRGGVFEFDYDRNYLLYNFRFGGRYCGRLVMAADPPRHPDGRKLILERLAELVQILLQRFGSFQFTSSVQTFLHSFLSASLAGKIPHTREIHRLMQNTGWREEHSYLMVLFLPEHRLKRDLYPPYLVSQVEERWRGACAVEYEGNAAMLLNLTLYGADKLTEFYQSLAYLVRDGLMVAGCSRPFTGLRELGLYFRQALYALEFGRKKDSTRWYFRFNDYGLEYLLSYGTGIFKPEQVCHPALLTLREHDQQRQTSYYATLYMYFQQQFNMSRAAEKLYIHRSTFINRMERIQELTHLNLEDYDTRLYLELSFRLLRDPEELTSQFYV